MSGSPYAHLVGHRFPGSRYTLPEHVCWLWSDAVGAEPGAAVAHPSLAYFVAMQGLGVGIRDVFEMFESGADSGVVMGEVELEFGGALTAGTTYECEAQVVGVDRKHGARAGVFDRLLLDFTVREVDEPEASVACTATWIFPRGGD